MVGSSGTETSSWTRRGHSRSGPGRAVREGTAGHGPAAVVVAEDGAGRRVEKNPGLRSDPGFLFGCYTQHLTMMDRRLTIKPGVASPGMAERLGDTVDERRGVEYHQLRSKELVNKFNGRPMPFGWTVNPFR